MRELILEDLAPRHHFLRLFVEPHFFARPHCRVGHDGGYRMLVSSLDRAVRLFAASHAFDPVAHMQIRQRVDAGGCDHSSRLQL